MMRWSVALALLVTLAGACGSVTSSGGDGGAGATGTGAAGTGNGGGGTAGSPGGRGGSGAGGCASGYVWCSGCEPGTGACYPGGCPGIFCPPPGGGGGGGAGASGTGGATGGVSGAGGRGGATGGAGGSISACQAVLALDRSCTTATDCFAGAHVVSCCGTAQYVGFRTTVQTQFGTLEAQCDASYPRCGCPVGPATTDDGSMLRFDQQPGVTCLQGKCTTFVPDCGKPCVAGTTCFSCVSHQTMFAACTTMCTDANQCSDPSLPLCQMGTSGNVSGKYCTAANIACDTK